MLAFRTAVAALCLFALAALTDVASGFSPTSSRVTLSIVGTSDLHGAALPRNGLGGLPLLAGYVNNLRSMSQGRAQFTMQFDHYAQAPQGVAEEVKAKFA